MVNTAMSTYTRSSKKIISYLTAAREIETSPSKELKPINIAILSTFTANLIHPYLVVEGAKRGMFLKTYFSPFNQLEQQIFDKHSSLYEFGPDVVIIATYIEENVMKAENRLRQLITGLKQFTTATILVFNYTGTTSTAINECITTICEQFTNTYVFDYAQIVYEFGYQHWYDPKLWYIGRIPFGVVAQHKLGQQLARCLHAFYFPPRKCLVVDLDNTLWGGVLSEEGLGGISLGEDYPGNVYKDFQRYLLSLSERGILLAIASKNNETEVVEAFQKHPDCILKLEDFVAYRINWQDKATNLVAIAKELNIGIGALAFFDDSPVEREWIRLQLPEVFIIEVPEDPTGFIYALKESEAFDTLVISEEDRNRTKLYQKEQERKQLQTKSTSLEEFLRHLNMKITVGYVDSTTLPRVVQLLAKTNQFNLTTRRHTLSEVQAMIDSGAVALWLRAVDCFGDIGLVGVAIAIPLDSKQWVIDTFLLSCRAIGRQVETVLLNILSRVVVTRGGRVLLGEYLSTPKNTPAATFYSTHGFEKAGEFWKWDLSKGEIPPPDFLGVEFIGEK